MTAPQRSPVLDDLIDVTAGDVEEGTRDHLAALVEELDAAVVSSFAAGPSLWALARQLRESAAAKLAQLEADRSALARARASSEARLRAALRWRGAKWLDAFRLPDGRDDLHGDEL